MTEDTSLDQFLGDSGEESDDSSMQSDDADDPPADSEVAPADVTLRYDPGGVDCPRCGESVERRWRDGDAFVCGACKEW